ncbi:spore coat protein CotJB [Clostridium fallax]|uniref:Spore coat protein JB n=1 Tax=Clostridium fallax TaxID=1533 RepID=A0A1M4XVK3_9CLOT|nr:spore coat protein CotJB [Clostridium fallax]SHE97509.1 spore coat protein JB [Clostridium fallax]SQB06513.1 spore coat protein CotJB [Clostridium fallax]
MKSVELLNRIQRMQFYAVELNLYLDNFPNNKKAIEDYREVSQRLKELIGEYELKYGPITNFGSACIEDPDSWINRPWPWEIKS